MVSIHTLHELEASPLRVRRTPVRISGCFHSYASRIGSKCCWYLGRQRSSRFPFIRFTNWKQENSIRNPERGWLYEFPFIRFTNWKQASWPIVSIRSVSYNGFHSYASRIGSKAEGCGWKSKENRFHSYASRIGSKTSFAKLGCTRIVQRFFVGYWKA